MMDRRSFLRRFGIGLAAVAAAPTLLAAVAPAETVVSGGLTVHSGGMDVEANPVVVQTYRDQHGRPYYATIHSRSLVVNRIGEMST